MAYKYPVKKLFEVIASGIDARLSCIKAGNNEWETKHEDNVRGLVSRFMPSGSGWDHGTHIDFDLSTSEKLVFYGAFHHMDESGYYDGWTEHSVTVRPSFISQVNISISGRDRNDIKDHIVETFAGCLRQLITWDSEANEYVEVEQA